MRSIAAIGRGQGHVGGVPTEPIDTSGRCVTPAREPAETLRVHADLLRHTLERPGRRPLRWTSPAFAREVELVRTHLTPIRSLEMLAASYGREGFHRLHGEPPPTAAVLLARNAAELAYAIRRWEVSTGETVPPWPALVG